MSQASASAYALGSLDGGLEGATLGRAERDRTEQSGVRPLAPQRSDAPSRGPAVKSRC